MKILITGLPGSGKTTQARKISQGLGLCMIKTGEILRKLAQESSSRGKIIKQALESGELADDKLVAEVVRERILEEDCKGGFVMDGYPRSVSQLKYFNPNYDLVFHLKLSKEEAQERLLQRGRADDTPEIIAKRLEIQSKELDSVLVYLKKVTQVVEVDGEQNELAVFTAIKSHL